VDYYSALTYDRGGIDGDTVVPTIKLQDGTNIKLRDIGAPRLISFHVKRKQTRTVYLELWTLESFMKILGSELERIWKDIIIDLR